MHQSSNIKVKIPVYHYTEITDSMQLNGIALGADCYLTNEGGKQFLVEIWR